MRLAVLREGRSGESRVALTPSSLPQLVKGGFTVAVESGAGSAAGFPDHEYTKAGAEVVPDGSTALQSADALLSLGAPSAPDGSSESFDLSAWSALPKGALVVSMLGARTRPDLLGAIAERGWSAFSLELVPRTTRAQSMDILSSQATVAGYKAVLLGAARLSKFLPMLTTAAGTIRPAKTLVLGAGVAGLQAIATARRLGSVVSAFDVRPAVKEQVESLGATFLEAEQLQAEGEGGYAKELSEEQHEKELELLAEHVPQADLIVTTAQIPGRKAPLLVTEEMVESMRAGSVVVDLAAESGGNCAFSKPDEEVVHGGVHILGPVNLPATLPYHASEMFARNLVSFLKLLAPDGEPDPFRDDDILEATCVVKQGEVKSDG